MPPHARFQAASELSRSHLIRDLRAWDNRSRTASTKLSSSSSCSAEWRSLKRVPRVRCPWAVPATSHYARLGRTILAGRKTARNAQILKATCLPCSLRNRARAASAGTSRVLLPKCGLQAQPRCPVSSQFSLASQWHTTEDLNSGDTMGLACKWELSR